MIESNFLNLMGLENFDIGYVLLGLAIIIVILLIMIIVSLSKISKLQKRLKKFMKGKDAQSLEKEIVGLYEDNKFLKNMVDNNKKDIRDLNSGSLKSLAQFTDDK